MNLAATMCPYLKLLELRILIMEKHDILKRRANDLLKFFADKINFLFELNFLRCGQDAKE